MTFNHQLLPRPTRAWLAGLLLGASAASAPAQPPASNIPSAQALDLELQGLKSEALALTRELRDAELGQLYPAGSRTSFYVSVKVPGFMLDGISVRINDKDSTAHRYTDTESRAMLRDGWHRLHVQRLEPGTYRLQADFSGHFADARGTDPAIRGRLETLFEKKGGADLDLVLPISRNTRLEKPAMSEIARQESRLTRPGRNVWLPEPESVRAPDASRPIGGEDDPRYRSAVYHRLGNRYVAALDELLDIEADVKDPATLSAAYQKLLADCYLGFGMQAAAEKEFDRLARAATPDPAKVAQGQIELARYEYQRGHFNPATVRLFRLKETLPSAAYEDWRLLLTYVLMAQEKFKDVTTLLIPQDGDIDDVQDLPAILRYNLAVALMKIDRGLEGRRLMNRVGQMEVKDLEALALRDKANLALGYQYLQLQNGTNAKALFGRVRTTGPFSGNALLGLGWAEIAIATAPPSAETEDEGSKGFLGSLAALFGSGGSTEKETQAKKIDVKSAGRLAAREADGYQRALIPWAELIERDPMDSAVEEAMLAIPWAMQKMEAYEDALKYYQRAIDTLEVARKRMALAQKSISSGLMVVTMIKDDLDSEQGWRWRLSNLADTPETYFMQSLLAEHRFQETLKDHRDARLIGRSLEVWKQRLDDLEKTWRAGQATTGSPSTSVEASAAIGSEGSALAADILASVPAAAATASPVKALRARLLELAPRVTQNGVAQNQYLEAISLKELAAQQEQIEKYLTEARFSVARIFDSQSRAP